MIDGKLAGFYKRNGEWFHRPQTILQPAFVDLACPKNQRTRDVLGPNISQVLACPLRMAMR